MSGYLSPTYTTRQGSPRRASREHLLAESLPELTSTVGGLELVLGVQDVPYAGRWGGLRRWGHHKVAGALRREGVPHRGRVYLFERRGLRLVRETTSGETGEYLFDQVPANTYLVMAFDTENFWERPDLNAAITDWVVSEPRDE